MYHGFNYDAFYSVDASSASPSSIPQRNGTAPLWAERIPLGSENSPLITSQQSGTPYLVNNASYVSSPYLQQHIPPFSIHQTMSNSAGVQSNFDYGPAQNLNGREAFRSHPEHTVPLTDINQRPPGLGPGEWVWVPARAPVENHYGGEVAPGASPAVAQPEMGIPCELMCRETPGERCHKRLLNKQDARQHFRDEHVPQDHGGRCLWLGCTNTWDARVPWKPRTRDAMIRHLVGDAGFESVSCTICEVPFSRRDALKRHVKNKHTE